MRPFLPGALEMDKTLSEARINSPPSRSRSGSPCALEKAQEGYIASNKNASDGMGRLVDKTGNRPGSRSEGSTSDTGNLNTRNSRQKKVRATSPFPSDKPETTLPRLVTSGNTDDQNEGFIISVNSPGIADFDKTTSADVLMNSAGLNDGERAMAAPGEGAGAGAKSSSKSDRKQLPAYAPPISQASDLFPVSSQLYVGLQGTMGHRPMVLTLLASKKPLWKVSGAQAFDPHLHLAAFPPPPDKIVVNLFDVGTINPRAGDKYHPQQASFVINVREYTALLYDMVEKYSKREEEEREAALKQRESVAEKVSIPLTLAQCPWYIIPRPWSGG